MTKPSQDLKIKIGVSPTLKIRGILASNDISKGEIIERCPLILIDVKEEEHLESTKLKEYYFLYNKKYHCIVLGYGSLYNHSFNPNSKIYRDYKRKEIVFKAIKDIKKGEEITYKYMEKEELDKYPEYKIR
jgi:SET domain-containing protein